MKVRKFDVDFSSLTPHWSSNREFAQLYNAASLCPAQLEPFMCKVLLKAKDREGMSAAAIAASKAREKRVKQITWRHAWRYILRIVSPFCSPHDRQPPPGLLALLDADNPAQFMQVN